MTSVGRLFQTVTLALGAAFLLTGCASSHEKAACVQRDWYELGRRDGSQGAALERLNQYKKECGAKFQNGWETVYVNGRNAGLVEYCMPENAFELGRMGLSYAYVCPSTMEPQFLAAYRKGQQARVLQLKKKDLDARIESLTEQLLQTSTGTYENRKIGSELEELKKRRAANEREIESSTK